LWQKNKDAAENRKNEKTTWTGWTKKCGGKEKPSVVEGGIGDKSLKKGQRRKRGEQWKKLKKEKAR